MVAAILHPRVSTLSFQFHFQFEYEICGFSAAPDDIGRAGGMLRTGYADDRAILYVPDIGVAIPIFERLAVEDLRPADVIAEIDRLGLNEVKCLWFLRFGFFLRPEV